MSAKTLYYIGLTGFGLGVASASIYTDFDISVLFLLLIGTALLIVGLRSRSSEASRYIVLVSVVLLTAALGVWRVGQYESTLSHSSAWPTGSEVNFTGLITREPDERSNTIHYYVKTEDETFLVTTNRYQLFAYGDRVKVIGVVKEPEQFETDLGRSFNYPGYLKAKGVTRTVSFAELSLVTSNEGNPLIAALLKIKNQFLKTIESLLPEPQAGLAEGLLLGVKRALGEDLERVFRSTGIIHIVVLSGYNIMLVVTFVMFLLAFLLPFRARLVVGLVAICAFALIVGLSSTVVRASLMAALALLAKMIGRTYSVVQALLIAGAIMLFINPYLLVFDVGFQLSFLATLGLILVAPQLEGLFKQVPTVVGIREFLIATLATQIFVLPILLYQIGELSVVAVLVNVLVLPMVPVAMLTTFLAVLVSMFSLTLSTPLAMITYFALTYIIEVPRLFATLPFASFQVPPFPFWLVIVAYVCIGYWFYRWQQPRRELVGWTIADESELPSLAPGGKENTSSVTPVFFR